MNSSFEKVVIEALRRNKAGYAARQLHKVFAVAATLTFSGIDPACRIGCCACCWTMPVLYSAIEVMAVRRHVMENINNARTRISAKLLAPMCDLHETISRMTSQAPWSDTVRAEWEETGLPCPALSLPEGKCLLYENRPLECHMRVNTLECSRPFYRSPLRLSAVPPLLLDASAWNEHDYVKHETDQAEQAYTYLRMQTSAAMKGVIDTCWKMDQRLFGAKGSPQSLAKVLSEAIMGR